MRHTAATPASKTALRKLLLDEALDMARKHLADKTPCAIAYHGNVVAGVEQGVEGAVDDALGPDVHPAAGGHLPVVGHPQGGVSL